MRYQCFWVLEVHETSAKVIKMSSDESESEFEGFSESDVVNADRELIAAEERLRNVLNGQGIGDDDEFDVEGSDGDDDDNDIVLNEAGDNNDGWHSNFDIRERGLPHIFTPRGITGPQTRMDPSKEAVDFWKLFVDDGFIGNLIEQTDSYANYQILNLPNSNKMPWTTPTLPEMKAFLGLTYQMGIVQKPSTKMYWSSDPLMSTPIFSSTMSRDRYTQILRYLHFSDHLAEPGREDPNYDPLYKIRPVVNHLNTKFGSEYVPKRNVSIDECMVPFKGRTNLKQYVPSKPNKWGVKVWMLASSDNSYIQYIDIYPGKTNRTEGSLASSVVKNCIESGGIRGQGYHVYTDNFFTSPSLLTELWDDYGTAACGTVRINRTGLPRDIMCKPPIPMVNNRGDFQLRQKGPLLATVWKDKRNVSALSTIHDNSVGQVSRLVNENGTFVRKELNCPKAIVDYTANMGGVDKADQYIQYYSFNQKTLKWPKKVFFRILEMVKFNAFRLFTLSPHHSSTITFLDFSLMLIKGLLSGYVQDVRRGRPAAILPDLRLVQRHMPAAFETKSRCHVCYLRCRNGKQDKVRQTNYGCQDCGKHLCLPACFTKYHTEKNYC